MEYIFWLCALIFLQCLVVGLYLSSEMRKPTPADQMPRHFGGV